MKLKNVILLITAFVLVPGCTTLDKSFQLGGMTGATVGAGAVYAGHSVQGNTPSLQEAAIGSSIGFGLGLLASYFIHQSVVDERETTHQETQMYFGDLPPSPFLMPSPSSKKRGKR